MHPFMPFILSAAGLLMASLILAGIGPKPQRRGITILLAATVLGCISASMYSLSLAFPGA